MTQGTLFVLLSSYTNLSHPTLNQPQWFSSYEEPQSRQRSSSEDATFHTWYGGIQHSSVKYKYLTNNQPAEGFCVFFLHQMATNILITDKQTLICMN